MVVNLHNIYNLELSQAQFEKLSKFIYSYYGIKLPPVKKIMLQSRLHKRLRELEIESFDEYIEYVFSKDGQESEVVHMIDVVSTNKTDFFREPSHFDFMTNELLPKLYNERSTQKNIKIWSSASSSGEEAYTIAIVMSEFIARNPGIDFSILGTDISTKVLKQAIDAIYELEKVNIIPLELKKKYLLKSIDQKKPKVRIIPELRKKVTFSRLNLMDDDYMVDGSFDIIFCRNVLIYFDKFTQEAVINKLCKKLKPGGIFFLGHSESITGIDVPLIQIKPTIYQRK